LRFCPALGCYQTGLEVNFGIQYARLKFTLAMTKSKGFLEMTTDQPVNREPARCPDKH
jgi:hypothetical protein